MSLQDILNNLEINNTKTDGTHYSVEQLKTIFSQASVNVPNASSGAITLTYSGELNNTVAYKAAEFAGEASNGQVRTVGQTDASKLLDNQEFIDALKKASGSRP